MQAETGNVSIEEAVLIERSRDGDRSAIEGLILKYQDRLYNVVLKMCGNRDDAAELTQDAFVKIIENIDRFRGASSFYTWAFRIAVNLTINRCKRSSRIGVRSLEAECDEREAHGRTALREYLRDERAAEPAAAAESMELSRLVLRALMQLDDAQRMVVVLRDIEGMNYAQIAEVCQIELGTVKSRLSRARSNLRDILEAFSQ